MNFWIFFTEIRKSDAKHSFQRHHGGSWKSSEDLRLWKLINEHSISTYADFTCYSYINDALWVIGNYKMWFFRDQSQIIGNSPYATAGCSPAGYKLLTYKREQCIPYQITHLTHTPLSYSDLLWFGIDHPPTAKTVRTERQETGFKPQLS